jgi:hypothetical protein
MNGLWIRSQDLSKIILCMYISRCQNVIHAQTCNDDLIHIATYDTEERAIQVMRDIFSCFGNGLTRFVMPKE